MKVVSIFKRIRIVKKKKTGVIPGKLQNEEAKKRKTIGENQLELPKRTE